jgi:hypothetical protein
MDESPAVSGQATGGGGPRIEIDLNVRLGQTMTFAGFEDLYGCEPDQLGLCMPITVCERESEVEGSAMVVGIDYDKCLVYVQLEWSRLECPR